MVRAGNTRAGEGQRVGGNVTFAVGGAFLTAIPCAVVLASGLLLLAALSAAIWLLRRYGWRRCVRSAAAAVAVTLAALAGSWLASLLLRDVIRDAEQVYASAHTAAGDHDLANGWPVWLLLAAVALAGYLVHGKREFRR
jgi:drug/metabolite transporter (DMT)-like permease